LLTAKHSGGNFDRQESSPCRSSCFFAKFVNLFYLIVFSVFIGVGWSFFALPSLFLRSMLAPKQGQVLRILCDRGRAFLHMKRDSRVLTVRNLSKVGAALVQPWCKDGAVLVQGWCSLGARMVRGWCGDGEAWGNIGETRVKKRRRSVVSVAKRDQKRGSDKNRGRSSL